MRIQESFLPSFPFFHLLLHWVRQPFLGIPPFISDPCHVYGPVEQKKKEKTPVSSQLRNFKGGHSQKHLTEPAEQNKDKTPISSSKALTRFSSL